MHIVLAIKPFLRFATLCSQLNYYPSESNETLLVDQCCLWRISKVSLYFCSSVKKFGNSRVVTFEIGTPKLTKGRCFPFVDKRVGRIMVVSIFEAFYFSIIIFFNLDKFLTLYNDILIKSNSKWIFLKVNLS